MVKLMGWKWVYFVGMGDMKGDFVMRFDEWVKGVYEVFGYVVWIGNLGEGVFGSGVVVESDDEDIEEDDGEVIFEDEEV